MAFVLLHIKVIHLVGGFLLFLGWGVLFAAGDNRSAGKAAAALHGTGLLLLLLAGFAIQGMGHYGFPLWLLLKIFLWIALAALFVVTKKGILSRGTGIALAILCGAAAAWLCVIGRITPGLM